MMEIVKQATDLVTTKQASSGLVQLNHITGNKVSMTDPDGKRMEVTTTEDGTKLVTTVDEEGKSLAIEERSNGTKVYHVSSDSTGLPSSHEVRPDQTEIVYFYDSVGKLQHFVEIKSNGDRESTILCEDGSIFSIEQKQIGGIVFKAWVKSEQPKEGLVWLHSDGEVSTHGDQEIIDLLFNKFSRFLDGAQ